MVSNLSSYPEQAPGSVTPSAHLTFLRLSFLIGTLWVGMLLLVPLSSQQLRVIEGLQTQLSAPGWLLYRQGVRKGLFLEETSGEAPQKGSKDHFLLSTPAAPCSPSQDGKCLALCCHLVPKPSATTVTQWPHSDADSESFSTQLSKQLLQSMGTGM